MGNGGTENLSASNEDQTSGSKSTDQLNGLEQNTKLVSLQTEITSAIETTSQRKEVHIVIKGVDVVVNYDENTLQKDYIRVSFMVGSNIKENNSLFSSPINFSIPKSFFNQMPANLNTDFYLSRKLSPKENENFDVLVIKLYAEYRNLFSATKATVIEAINDKSVQAAATKIHSEEFFEDTSQPDPIVATHNTVKEPLLSSGRIGEHYSGAQYNLPSKNYLTISDGITQEVNINDLIVPGYKVIQIKSSDGGEVKARWNGKSYIALGGEQKGLIPVIQNGDSFKNVSDSHEIVIRPTSPQTINSDKTYCYLFATQYTINDLVTHYQDTILVNYTNTSKNIIGVHEAIRDNSQGTYIDTFTKKRVLVYDGVQISSATNSNGRIPAKEEDAQQDIGENRPEQAKREHVDVVTPLPKAVVDIMPSSKTKNETVEGSFSPDKRPDYIVTGNVTRNNFCEGLHAVESSQPRRKPYGYKAVNQGSTEALGRYQFVPRRHPDLLRVSGVKTKEEFLASPEAQEKYMDHWIVDLKKSVKYVKKHGGKNTKNYSDLQLFGLCHFLGKGGANRFLKTGEMTEQEKKGNLSYAIYLKRFTDGVSAAMQKKSTTQDIATK